MISCKECIHGRHSNAFACWWCDAPLPAWVIYRNASEWIQEPEVTAMNCKCFDKKEKK